MKRKYAYVCEAISKKISKSDKNNRVPAPVLIRIDTIEIFKKKFLLFRPFHGNRYDTEITFTRIYPNPRSFYSISKGG